MDLATNRCVAMKGRCKSTYEGSIFPICGFLHMPSTEAGIIIGNPTTAADFINVLRAIFCIFFSMIFILSHVFISFVRNQ